MPFGSSRIKAQSVYQSQECEVNGWIIKSYLLGPILDLVNDSVMELDIHKSSQQ